MATLLTRLRRILYAKSGGAVCKGRPRADSFTMKEMAKINTGMLSSKQRALLAAFIQTTKICEAAEVAKVSRRSHYNWLRNSVYAAQFANAQVQACKLFEETVLRRAVERRKARWA